MAHNLAGTAHNLAGIGPDQPKMAAEGAGMTRKCRIVMVSVAIAFLIAGCGRMSDDTVRDKDQQRIETSKGMPGNDVPLDPADGR